MEEGAQGRPWPWQTLELALAAALPKRLVGTRWLTTFLWGWKRMMCSLGAKRQPSTTEPLRLTDTHMVVVCTCGAEAEGESVPKARPGTGGPAHAAGEAVGEAVSICWASAHLPSPEGRPGRSGTVPALAPVARLSGRTCRAACAWARVWGCGYDVHACQRTHVCVGACVQGVVGTCRCACASMGCVCRWEDVRAHP